MRVLILAGAVLLISAGWASPAQNQPVIIGSKKFTESYVLAEIAKQVVERAGVPVELRPGMGGTVILWEALRGGAIARYPEYTRTLREVILHGQHAGGNEGPADLELLRQRLAPYGIGMTEEWASTTPMPWSCGMTTRGRWAYNKLAICESSPAHCRSEPRIPGASRWMESAVCQIWAENEARAIAGAHTRLPRARQRRN